MTQINFSNCFVQNFFILGLNAVNEMKLLRIYMYSKKELILLRKTINQNFNISKNDYYIVDDPAMSCYSVFS